MRLINNRPIVQTNLKFIKKIPGRGNWKFRIQESRLQTLYGIKRRWTNTLRKHNHSKQQHSPWTIQCKFVVRCVEWCYVTWAFISVQFTLPWKRLVLKYRNEHAIKWNETHYVKHIRYTLYIMKYQHRYDLSQGANVWYSNKLITTLALLERRSATIKQTNKQWTEF